MIHILSKLFFKYKLLLSIVVITVITNLFIVSKLYTYIENKKKSTASEHFYADDNKYYSNDSNNNTIEECHIHKDKCPTGTVEYCRQYARQYAHCHLIPKPKCDPNFFD